MLEVVVPQGISMPGICQKGDVGEKLSAEDGSKLPESNDTTWMFRTAYERDAGSNVLLNS
ncbi:MAG: hypothetical protein M3P37_06240 [Actinomycetota bacterium]|nr:hypothetical protein [Actinomycetota bacterium]